VANLSAHEIDVFENELYVAAQNKGGFMRPRSRRKTGVIGLTVYFPKLGIAGPAQPKTRNGKVPLLDIARTRVSCVLTDNYAGIQDSILFSLNRKEDDIAIAALVSGTNANDSLAADDTWSSDLIPRTVLQQFGDAEIMDGGDMFAMVKWKTWNDLLSFNSFINSQYGGNTELTSEGQAAKMYFGFAYTPFSRMPTHSSGSKLNVWWNKKVVGVAVGAEIRMTVERLPEYDADQIMGKMSQGACLVDPIGVIKRRYS
jgi:hypothetical protein